MPGQWIKVQCRMQDCMYYNADRPGSANVFCSHDDKSHYMHSLPCPLYRLDWQKKAAMAQNLIKTMKR